MQNTTNPLIFVVIENLDYNNVVVSFLKSKRYNNIKSFTSGTESLKHLKEMPDIFVCNYSMKDINGLDLMNKVKEEISHVDFFFLSSQKDMTIAISLIKYGASDYIIKNEKALLKLAKSIEYAINSTKSIKVKKGFRIGVLGFFIVLFIIIMVILSLAVFFPDDFNFTF